MSAISTLAAPERTEARSARTAELLDGPILSTLLRLAWPNVLVMIAQASTGLIETFWVSRLGADALAGMALVFPGYMMMGMLSGGAVGGGIASAVARALGGGRRADADALVMHALLINVVLGIATSALFLLFGRAVYAAMGGQGGSLEAALRYSNVVFAGNTILWVMNGFASVIRGSGEMRFPSLVICIGVVLLIPLSPLLIFGVGSFHGFGVAGGGVAVVATTTIMTILLGWYVVTGKGIVRLRRARLRWPLFADILKVGGAGALNTLLTTFTVALTTGLVGAASGPDGVAGYGTAARLEYLLIPLVFGVGAPLVAMVGANIGAGQRERALHIALTGGAASFIVCEAIGIVAALFPAAWLRLFGADPSMLAVGTAYLHSVGPTYGFFGLGLSLYFASQGAGRLAWPLIAGGLRFGLAVGGGWLAWRLTGSLGAMFAMLGAALVAYGLIMAAAVRSGAWFGRG
jgi:putative MATE family efflux protein